ncbi:MAG: type II toxin-antitoxin system VapB family antitoxin [Gammaproteobacteria bacterium]
MATNLALDDKLIHEVQQLSGQATKKAAVTEALLEYIQKRQQLKIIDLFGTIEYDDYNYKKQRKIA